jgi:hypothetical protein
MKKMIHVLMRDAEGRSLILGGALQRMSYEQAHG